MTMGDGAMIEVEGENMRGVTAPVAHPLASSRAMPAKKVSAWTGFIDVKKTSGRTDPA